MIAFARSPALEPAIELATGDRAGWAASSTRRDWIRSVGLSTGLGPGRASSTGTIVGSTIVHIVRSRASVTMPAGDWAEAGLDRGSGRLALAEDRIAALVCVGFVVAGHVPRTVAAVRGRLTAWRCCPASVWELTRARRTPARRQGGGALRLLCLGRSRYGQARRVLGSPWRTRVISAWVMLGCVCCGPAEARSAVRVAARSGLGRAVAPIRPRPRGRFHGSFGQRRGRGR